MFQNHNQLFKLLRINYDMKIDGLKANSILMSKNVCLEIGKGVNLEELITSLPQLNSKIEEYYSDYINEVENLDSAFSKYILSENFPYAIITLENKNGKINHIFDFRIGIEGLIPYTASPKYHGEFSKEQLEKDAKKYSLQKSRLAI